MEEPDWAAEENLDSYGNLSGIGIEVGHLTTKQVDILPAVIGPIIFCVVAVVMISGMKLCAYVRKSRLLFGQQPNLNTIPPYPGSQLRNDYNKYCIHNDDKEPLHRENSIVQDDNALPEITLGVPLGENIPVDPESTKTCNPFKSSENSIRDDTIKIHVPLASSSDEFVVINPMMMERMEIEVELHPPAKNQGESMEQSLPIEAEVQNIDEDLYEGTDDSDIDAPLCLASI